jgi:hypothetical protein
MKKYKKTLKWKNIKKTTQKRKNPAAAAGRPSITSTRAERGSVPLMGGA